jgi:hypothetical protein
VAERQSLKSWPFAIADASTQSERAALAMLEAITPEGAVDFLVARNKHETKRKARRNEKKFTMRGSACRPHLVPLRRRAPCLHRCSECGWQGREARSASALLTSQRWADAVFELAMARSQA